MKKIPAMIRPIIKAGFKKKTGRSIQDWIQKAKALVQAVEGGTSLAEVDASINDIQGSARMGWPDKS